VIPVKKVPQERKIQESSCEKSATGAENTGILRIPAGITNLACFQTNNFLWKESFENRLQHQRTTRTVSWDDVLIDKHRLCIVK